MKGFIRIAALALAAAVAAGAGPSLAAGEPVRIDAILAQTGGAAFLGTEEAKTLKLVEKYVNDHGGIGGRPVEFVVNDEQSNPQTSVQLMNQVLSHKPSVVIGTGFTATCKAIMPLVETSGPTLYCITPGVQPKAGTYVFSANISTHDLAPVNLRFFHEKGWNRVAIVTSTDATGQDFEAAFNEALERPEFKGMNVVAREHFNTTDISVTAQMTRIKAANPQAVILWATGTGFGTLLRGFHDVGVEAPAAGGNGNLIWSQLEQFASFIPKEMYFAAPPVISQETGATGAVRAAQMPYFAALKSAGLRSDIPTTMAWDPAMLIVDALRKLGPDASPEKVKDYIDGQRSWTGILGVYNFVAIPQRGLGENNAVMLRYDAAKNDVTVVSRPGGVLRAR